MLKIEKIVTLFNQDKVVNWLNMRGRTEIAQKIENLSYNVGVKGERYPEMILTTSVKEKMDKKLFMELECDVIQFMIDTKKLYYVGILDCDVEVSKKSLAL